jgi:multidrug/hemolysin transport system permease protein
MNTWVYTKRSVKLYLRDPASIFFSLLGPGILLVLYALFLGKLSVNSITEAMPTVDAGAARGLAASWTLAALLMVISLTSPLVAMSQIVSSRVSHGIDDFLVSPLTKRQIVGATWLGVYIYAGAIMVFFLVVGLLAIKLLGAQLPDAGGLALTVVACAVSLAVFSALHVLIGTALTSESQEGGLAGVFSSVVGFLAGIYIPPGVLGQGMATVIFAQPFGQAALLIRDPLATPSLNALMADGGARGVAEMRNVYGFDLLLGGEPRPLWIAWAGVIALGLICAFWAMARVRTLGRR